MGTGKITCMSLQFEIWSFRPGSTCDVSSAYQPHRAVRDMKLVLVRTALPFASFVGLCTRYLILGIREYAHGTAPILGPFCFRPNFPDFFKWMDKVEIEFQMNGGWEEWFNMSYGNLLIIPGFFSYFSTIKIPILRLPFKMDRREYTWGRSFDAWRTSLSLRTAHPWRRSCEWALGLQWEEDSGKELELRSGVGLLTFPSLLGTGTGNVEPTAARRWTWLVFYNQTIFE